MKMNSKLFILATAAAILAACAKENEEPKGSVAGRITAGVSGPKTARWTTRGTPTESA